MSTKEDIRYTKEEILRKAKELGLIEQMREDQLDLNIELQDEVDEYMAKITGIDKVTVVSLRL